MFPSSAEIESKDHRLQPRKSGVIHHFLRILDFNISKGFIDMEMIFSFFSLSNG